MYLLVPLYLYVIHMCINLFLDDKFTPSKHLTPPPTTAAASPQRLTPKRRHSCCTKKKGRARRRTAPTDLAHSWPTQARPRRRAFSSRLLIGYEAPYWEHRRGLGYLCIWLCWRVGFLVCCFCFPPCGVSPLRCLAGALCGSG